LIKEAKGTPVQLGSLSPGMVITDFILDKMRNQPREKLEANKKIFNVLADRVETVAPFLVESILKNNKSGTKIVWLTPAKVIFRFLKSVFTKRDLMSEFGI
jgi:short-subunit dehydrogenase